MAMSIKNITADDFSSVVLNSDIPVLVDFYASWCGPCKMFGPIFESVEKETNDKVYIFPENETLNFHKEICNYFYCNDEAITTDSELSIETAEAFPTAKDLNFISHHLKYQETNILLCMNFDVILPNN